jgi:large subunit ribosomal protein L10
MDNPRPEKVAVVEEVKEKFSGADAAVLTDYRGIDVGGMGELRRALRAAGADYKIYKNTLVRFAVRDLELEIEDWLLGPTAIAFIPPKEDGTPGDPVLVAKALRDFARTNDNLEIKGGLLGDKLLSVAEVRALADVAPREELLARFAGGLAAPLQQFAGLLQALPRNFAYGLAALIEQGGGPDAPPAEPEAETAPTEARAEEETDEEPSADEPTAEAEAPEPEATAEAPDETEAAPESATEEEEA